LRLSPSAVASLRDCPLRWFLDRRVGAGNPSGGAAVVGLVVHAVAEAIARGDVAADQREIGPFVDEIWASVPFPAHYQRVNERRRVDEMITALLAWDASTGRSVAATELAFNVPVPGTSRPVHVSGLIDRVDRSEDGRLHVVDFKTGRTAATAAATAEHPQLGIYQLAIRQGALDTSAGPPASASPVVLGQAELVHLADRYTSGMPKVRIQAPLDEGWTWVNDLIVDAARLADGPEYPARPNGQCTSCAFRFMCPAQVPDPAQGPDPAQNAVTIGAAVPLGALAATPLTANRPLARSEAGPPSADQPRTTTSDGPVQQTLWGDDLS
jgi:RecB family exonuclease